MPDSFPNNLRKGDKWWLISADGSVTYSIFGACYSTELFEWNRKIGNVFETEEEAKESLVSGIWAERINADFR